ncbi:MAG: hypothetical protein ACJASR_000138 [Psychroserpens sp.]|jgi:hypothetical protein
MTKKIIEISGVKMEIDLRHATQIHDEIKIGSKVKLLYTEYSEPKVYHGIVCGFENFKTLPTIHVCYLVDDYSGTEIKFAYINSKTSSKYEIVPAIDWSPLAKKADIMNKFDRKVLKLENEIEQIKEKKSFCEKYFNKFIEEVIKEETN